MVVRVVVGDRGVLRERLVSWLGMAVASLLLAALITTDLFIHRGEPVGALDWLETGITTALVGTLLAGLYFQNVREHARLGELHETARAQTARSQRLEAILRLSGDLRTAMDVQQVLDLAAAAVRDTVSFRESAIYVYEAEDEVYRAAVAWGKDPEYNKVVLQQRIPAAVAEGLLRDEFRRGNCYFVDHARYAWSEEELRYFPPGDIPDRGPGWFHRDDALLIPLRDHDGTVLGLFDLYDPEDGRVPGVDTLQLLEIFANVTASAIENARAAEDLRQRAVTDGLTGLYNHRHFQETMLKEVDRAARYGLVFTLLMMDLDLFKQVNDRLGHPRGDEALQAVSEVLQSCARSTDFVARYGGEEFVMILPGTGVRQAASLAQRIANEVRAIELPVADPPRLTISIGMADYPSCGRDRESIIAAADAALLFAKRSGRDMVADFSQISLVELDEPALEGLAFRLEKADLETLEALAAAIDLRDAFGGRRSQGVADAAAVLASEMDLDEHQRDVLRTAALIYDIGKIGIPLDVLNQQEALSNGERETVRAHPEVGTRLLRSAARLEALLPVVLHHHERWDGTGYPDGLAGEQIPFAARVIAICDAYQAMVSDRPYREAMSHHEAVAELRQGAGTQFDPALVEAFVRTAATAGTDAPAASGDANGEPDGRS